LTRTQKKASYDVNKDGVKVAVLTFPKSSYRLGETISGVVELNERRGRARVVQVRFLVLLAWYEVNTQSRFLMIAFGVPRSTRIDAQLIASAYCQQTLEAEIRRALLVVSFEYVEDDVLVGHPE
jgi:hypothetical protein